MSNNISRRIEQMVEKFCDDYCGSVDCANCGVSVESVTEFLKAERTGHWVWNPDGMDWNIGAWVCSECRRKPETWWECDERHNPLNCAGSHFCGNCGADMRGENDERKQMGL